MVDMDRTDEDRAERRPSGQVSDGVACVCGHSANYHRVPVLGRCFLCSCSWYTIPSRVTSDAPLPPPDVQRPTPPLTEEELGQWEAIFPGGAVARLVAALRSVQEENERLRDDRAPLTDEELTALMKVGPDADEVRRLIADLRAARERVKELEAELAWVDERIDSGEL